jgi:hypothetical protein
MKVDRRSPEYEQDCLEAVRRVLLGNEGVLNDRVRVRSVDLIQKGERALIVASVIRAGAEAKIVWRLYEDVFSGTMPPGHAEHPEGVADQMLVWAIGG